MAGSMEKPFIRSINHQLTRLMDGTHRTLLDNEELPDDENEVHRLRSKATMFSFVNDQLLKGSYRNAAQTPTSETPLSLAYEVVIPIKAEIPSARCQ